MNVGLHQIAKGAVNELVALHGSQAFEIFGHDADAEVPPAIACAGMSGVQMTVVDELDLIRVQVGAQLRANAFDAGHGALRC